MHSFLFAILAASLITAFVSSFAFTRVLVTSSPARSGTEIVVKQLHTVRVITARPTVTGYKRERFDIWDGSADCNTRHKVLVTWFGGSICLLNGGPLREILDSCTDDPVSAHEIDIDHIYSLAAAWNFGAYTWDAERRRRSGNDIETNLTPTQSAVSRDKGNASPAGRPPEDAEACSYSHRCSTVAVKWGLPVSSADWKAMAAVYGIRAGKGTR